MKVKSALLTEMSGKIGGAVASRARGGIQYMRKLVTPSNPRTTLQTAVRAGLASISVFWRTSLTESQVLAWWDQAEGSKTGLGLFTKANQQRRYAANSGRAVNMVGSPTPAPGIGYIVDPPDGLSTPLTAPSSIVIDDSSNSLTLNGLNTDDPWNDPGLSETQWAGLSVYVTQPQSATRLSRQHPYQLAASAINTDGDGGITSLTIDLAGVDIITVAGKVQYVRLVAWDAEGRVSTQIEQRVTAVA